MGKTRLFAVAACAAAFVGVGASGALAGDITGKPGASKYIAGSDDLPLNGKSACAYSGLNDEYYIQGILTDPRTQSWGQIVRAAGGNLGGAGPAGCNPHVGEG